RRASGGTFPRRSVGTRRLGAPCQSQICALPLIWYQIKFHQIRSSEVQVTNLNPPGDKSKTPLSAYDHAQAGKQYEALNTKDALV
ncbi:MAG: hypothetical protein NUV76_09180, partial [Candidatus Kuenenia sp.]|nr:hypothetical protein [Candidatus Kuenenia sp.]